MASVESKIQDSYVGTETSGAVMTDRRDCRRVTLGFEEGSLTSRFRPAYRKLTHLPIIIIIVAQSTGTVPQRQPYYTVILQLVKDRMPGTSGKTLVALWGVVLSGSVGAFQSGDSLSPRVSLPSSHNNVNRRQRQQRQQMYLPPLYTSTPSTGRDEVEAETESNVLDPLGEAMDRIQQSLFFAQDTMLDFLVQEAGSLSLRKGRREAMEEEDQLRVREDTILLLLATVPSIFAFLAWEDISHSLALFLDKYGAIGRAVDGGQFTVTLLRPTITGIVVPVISIALATLVSTTVNVLRARQVELRALINKEACELRLLRRAIFGMFGTRQHASRRAKALALLCGYVEQLERESNVGAVEALEELQLSGGISINELDQIAEMLHGVDGAAASRQGVSLLNPL